MRLAEQCSVLQPIAFARKRAGILSSRTCVTSALKLLTKGSCDTFKGERAIGQPEYVILTVDKGQMICTTLNNNISSLKPPVANNFQPKGI